MNAYRFLFMVLVMMGVAFSLTYFGPGTTGYDCEAGGTVTINTPDVYLWNQTGATQMNFQTGAWEDYCIKITTDDVYLDCNASGGVRGTINGTDQTDALIFVADGLDNVTIVNCHLENSTDATDGMGIQLGAIGAGLGVSNVILDNNYIYNTTFGVYAYNLTDSEMTNNEFEDQTTIAVIVQDFSEVLFEDNEAHGAPQRGVIFSGASTLASGAYIYNNTIYDINGIGYDGLALWNVEDSQVMDNEVHSVDRGGIVCLDVRETTFSGNEIHDNGLTSSNYAGLRIAADSNEVEAVDVHILNNEIYDNAGLGMSVYNLTDGSIVGNEVYGSGAGQIYGIYVINADPSTISDNEIYDHTLGLGMADLDDITIQDNYIHDNTIGAILGIYQFASNVDVDFIDNNITSNGEGINITLSHGITFTGNNISDNTNHGLYMNLTENATFTDNYFQNNADVGAYLYWCDGASFDGNAFYNNADGLYLDWSWYATVEDNEFDTNSPCGIESIDSWYVSIHSNDFMNNGGGPAVYISDAYANNVTSNTMDGDEYGVYVDDSDEIYVFGNTIDSAVETGIHFESGVTNSVIEGNTVSNSDEYAIYISSSSDNDIIDNEVYMSCQGTTIEGAVYIETTDLMAINDNLIHDNLDCDAGLFLTQADYATIDPNHVYNNVQGITLDTCDYATLEDNLIYNNTDWGIYFDSCDYATMDGNTIYENNAYGVYFANSEHADVIDNTIYDHWNGYGIVFDGSGSGTLEDNTIYLNSIYGVYLINADDMNFTHELYYDNNGSGLYTTGSQDMIMEGCTFSGNGYDGLQYAIEGDAADDSNFTDCTFYDNYGAIYLDNSPNLEFHGITSYDNDNDAFYLTSCDNFLIQDADVYAHRAGGYTYYFDSCTGEIYDSVSRDSGTVTYGIELLTSSEVNLTNFEIYGNVDSYLYVEAGSTLNAENLWIGVTDVYGINYQTITIDDETDMFGVTAILDEDFISINSTALAELNVPANLSTRVAGCGASMLYYNDSTDELPTTTAQIIANGDTFEPEYAVCGTTTQRATYSVDGFSGYLAVGPTPSDGSSSLESMSMGVSPNPVVGEEVTITVKDGGNPLSNAEVKVRVLVGGVYLYETLGNTNSAGVVTFTPEYSGNYKATATKTGYHTETSYFSVGTGSGAIGCTTDSDCAVGLICTNNQCKKATTPVIEETPGDSGPSGIGCVSNFDCQEGYICEENQCLKDTIVEEPEGGPTDEDAMQAIYEAEQAIDAAKKAGKDTTEAEKYLVQAEAAYAKGDYEEAANAANEAKTLAQHATAPTTAPPATEPTAPTVVPEPVPTAPGAATPPAEDGGFPWIWVGLGVIVIAGIAYWFFVMRK